jgi:hypothetical protein
MYSLVGTVSVTGTGWLDARCTWFLFETDSSCPVGHYWPVVPAADDNITSMEQPVESEWTAEETSPPPQVLLCAPQIPHDLTRARTRAALMGSPA